MRHVGHRSASASYKKAGVYAPARILGGDDGDRTHDLRLAKPALSQLSYVPLINKRPSGDSAHAGALIVKGWWA